MALGTPTVVQEKKSATAPLDLYRFVFAGDTYPGSGGYTAFKAFVRTALKRDVEIAYVKRASPLKSNAHATQDLFPTYNVADDKLYFMQGETGEECASDDITSGETIDLIVACY